MMFLKSSFILDGFIFTKSKQEITKQESFDFPPRILYENRYCNQNDFSVLVCGVMNKNLSSVKSVHKLDGHELKCKKFTSMPMEPYYFKTAVINKNLYVFGGCSRETGYISFVKKFCNKTKTWLWRLQTGLDFNSSLFSTFKQNIYVIYYDSKCFTYNFENSKLTQLADMKQNRNDAACTVFEGKIVVTGGFSKSVEAYDHYEYEWAYLPDMIEEIEFNASVSMGNKMYVIGGMSTTNCEIFDSFSRKFTFIKPDIPNYKSSWFSEYQAVAKGNFILIISENKYKDSKDTTMYIFDVQKSQ